MFLQKLALTRFKFTNANDQKLFTTVRSLRYLNELDLCDTTITKAGAKTLKKVLPSLNNLTRLQLPNYRISNDKNGASFRSLEEAARTIPCLKIVK